MPERDQPSVFIADASKLTTSDYKPSFTSPTAYTITRLSDNTTVSGGALAVGQTVIPATGDIDGFQIQVSATPTFAAGDNFSIQPTRLGAQNFSVALQTPEGLALAQPVRTDASLANTGGGVISQGVMVPQYQAATAGTGCDDVGGCRSFDDTGLLIKFTSATTFEILDNSNPPLPSPAPPLATGTFVAGQSNVVQINDSATGAPSYQFSLSGNPATNDQFHDFGKCER